MRRTWNSDGDGGGRRARSLTPRALAGSLVAIAIGLGAATPLAAQGYRVHLDTRMQSVAYRGIQAESVAVSAIVTRPDGSTYTPDGYAAICYQGATMCTYYVAGPSERGVPVVTSADFSIWGLGVPGLSIRGSTRMGFDAGTADVWPGTKPAMQLLSGYLQYVTDAFTAELGRTYVTNRFGFHGFDGIKATGRAFSDQLSATAYGGWGLANDVALPVNSPALQPLDEYQPQDRQWIAGGEVALRLPRFTGRVLYERQVDRRSDYFVSERTGFDVSMRPVDRLTFTGGADYDLAEQWWGTWQLSANYILPHDYASATVGVKRYRPFFELWTIWGAFSPVPYLSKYAALEVHPTSKISLNTRGEIYAYDNASVSTPLSSVDSTGWRWSLGATVLPVPSVSLQWNYHLDFGPGASDRGFEAYATWTPTRALMVSGQLAKLQRPLEFRYDESDVWAYGLSGSYRMIRGLQFDLSVLRYQESRIRPDANVFDWNQFRINAGVSMTFGSGADRPDLPDAILRIPDVGGKR
ncbi:MAG TPA: hypothetical protein VJ992_00870 [Gemmatimonadales bacterium]|nr:hypothetical protein [Gemmatimonadales bacterium]